ncbi:MAG: sporulation integral membrane protein YtvI [Firmicutes bacterium]|nr:sporulation integral membrane protein YtvI [Bacillota bacterium]
METEKRRKFIIDFTYFLIIAVLTVLAFKFVLPALIPFIAAFVVATLLRKPIAVINGKLKIGKKASGIIAVVCFYVLVGFAVAFAGTRIVNASKSFIEAVPHMYSEHIMPALNTVFASVEGIMMQFDTSFYELFWQFETELMQYLGNLISGFSTVAVGAVSGLAGFVPGFFIKTILMVISTFFMAADYDRIVGFFMKQIGEEKAIVFADTKNYISGTLLVCLRSYGIIMLLTFAELAIGLTILRIKHAVIIAAIIAVFDILPMLGTGGILIPWGIIALATGNAFVGIGLLVLYVLIIVVRNIVEPKIVGGQLGLHPIVTLASMFAGLQICGILGLFGFPILLSLIVNLNKKGTINIFKN